jgi:hypothetical protein
MFDDLENKTIIKNTNNINNNIKTTKKKKESTKKTTAFNIDTEVIEQLKEISEQEDRSLSSLANIIFKKFIKNYEK